MVEPLVYFGAGLGGSCSWAGFQLGRFQACHPDRGTSPELPLPHVTTPPQDCAWPMVDPQNYSIPLLSPPAQRRHTTQDPLDFHIRALATFCLRNKILGHTTTAPTQTFSPVSIFITLPHQTDTHRRKRTPTPPHTHTVSLYLSSPYLTQNFTGSLPTPQNLQEQFFSLLLNMAKNSRAGEGKCVIQAKVSPVPSSTGCS